MSLPAMRDRRAWATGRTHTTLPGAARRERSWQRKDVEHVDTELVPSPRARSAAPLRRERGSPAPGPRRTSCVGLAACAFAASSLATHTTVAAARRRGAKPQGVDAQALLSTALFRQRTRAALHRFQPCAQIVEPPPVALRITAPARAPRPLRH